MKNDDGDGDDEEEDEENNQQQNILLWQEMNIILYESPCHHNRYNRLNYYRIH